MSIEYLSHDDINKLQWNNCIANACNKLIYAEAEYLDAMSPGWDALVMPARHSGGDDYDAVMPITWRKKLGIKYVCPPAFCQQLGVFYTDEKYRQYVPDFLKRLSIDFRLIETYLNYDNQPVDCTEHTNYILPLAEGYKALYDKLSPRYIQSLKRAARYPMEYIKEDDPTEAIEAYRLSYSDRMHIRPQDFEQFTLLAKTFVKSGRALVRSVRQPDGTLLAATVLLKDDRRLYNMINVPTANGRTLEANYFLYDRMLEEFALTGLLFDFEGSDLPGVAKFYQKLSPVNQPYFFWKSNRLPAVMRWWKH